MSEELEYQVLKFVQSRHQKGETTASRHIHIRFDIEISTAEKILENLAKIGKISKFYDEDYQEYRYTNAIPS